MSWSAECKIPKGTFTSGSIEIDDMVAMGNEDCPTERQKSLSAAKSAIVKLIALGAFGEPDENTYIVRLSGHVNPDNKPRKGWANDFVNISIIQE